MGLVTRTYNFVNGTIADGDQVDTDFNTLYTLANGNIDNDNIKPAAGIDGSKIASGSINTAQLANDSVDNNKLKDDAAVDVNRAVTRDHIRDLAINYAKLALLAVGSNSIHVVESAEFTIVGFSGGGTTDTAIPVATHIPLAIYLTNHTNPIESIPFGLHFFNDGTANWKVRRVIDAGANCNFKFKASFIRKLGT